MFSLAAGLQKTFAIVLGDQCSYSRFCTVLRSMTQETFFEIFAREYATFFGLSTSDTAFQCGNH